MNADVAVTEAAAVIVMTTDTVAMREATTATTSADMRDDMRTVQEATIAPTTERIDDMKTVTTQVDETMSATMSAASAMTIMAVANATTTRAKSVVIVATEATEATATALVAATAAALDMTAIDTSVPVTVTVADLASQPPAVARHTPSLPHDLRHASRMEVRAIPMLSNVF